MKQSSRHIPCAVTLKKQSFLSLGGRHSECACYFLNGKINGAQAEVLNQFSDRLAAIDNRGWPAVQIVDKGIRRIDSQVMVDGG